MPAPPKKQNFEVLQVAAQLDAGQVLVILGNGAVVSLALAIAVQPLQNFLHFGGHRHRGTHGVGQLACLFSKKYDTWGYDIKAEKVAKLAKSAMEDNRPVSKALEQGLKLTSNIDDLKKCNVYIIAVPTPVNKSNKPDISCVRNATAEVGKILKEGDIVVYESTVYPGLTEEVCAPLLASTSGLKLNQSFFVGFSPERINPGDTVHTIENIVKVTSGSTPEAAAIIDSLYASVLTHVRQNCCP